MAPVQLLELVLLLLSAAVLLAVAARRLRIPPAAAYVAGGLALAVVPGVPGLELDPALIMTLFLPPLLQGSAYFTNWSEFVANLRPILLLAVGCVAFSTAVLGAVLHQLDPLLPWAACLTLGAIISPPDAVAASAILQRLRLPRRLVSVLEGESLVNDATGLVLYRVAVAAAIGGTFSPALAGGNFVATVLGGILVGVACGRAVLWVMARLRDTHLEIAVSFLVAWASYIAAEQLHVSGVLSTVCCGLVMGWRQHSVTGPRTRIEAQSTWRFVIFVLEALVFILIGLSLRGVLARLGLPGVLALLPVAGWITLAAVGARIVWVYPAVYLPRLLYPPLRRRDPNPPLSYPTVLAWAGMRGVVSLAAALALPEAFPGRDLILFVTFAVIVLTVLVQGTTLGPLIRLLGLVQPDDDAVHEAAARSAIERAELQALEARANDVMDGAIARDVLAEARARSPWAGAIPRSGAAFAELQARVAIELQAKEAGRQALHALRREHVVPETILHELEHELDTEELRARRLIGAAP